MAESRSIMAVKLLVISSLILLTKSEKVKSVSKPEIVPKIATASAKVVAPKETAESSIHEVRVLPPSLEENGGHQLTADDELILRNGRQLFERYVFF